jgi:hypothetical protein
MCKLGGSFLLGVGLWVLLECRYRPHVVNALLDSFVQSKSLVSASNENHDLTMNKKIKAPFEKRQIAHTMLQTKNSTAKH